MLGKHCMKRKVSQHVIAHYWEDPPDLETAAHASIVAWEIHGQRSLVGYSPWGRKESDTTERAHSSSSHKQKSQLSALRLLVTRAPFSLINETRLETDFIAYKCVWCFCTFMLDLLLAILIILGICINSILEWTVLHLFCILNQGKTWGTEKKMLRWRLGCPIFQRFFIFF